MSIEIPLNLSVPSEYNRKKQPEMYAVYLEDTRKLEKFINALAQQENPQLQWNYLELGQKLGLGQEFVQKCLKPLSSSFHEVTFTVKKNSG
jgi:hypothetical protein